MVVVEEEMVVVEEETVAAEHTRYIMMIQISIRHWSYILKT